MEVLNDYQSEVFQEAKEHPQPVIACVQGSVPSWISGTFLQVGPGKYTWNKTSYNHWFEGDAILIRFRVSSGKVEFSSKFIKTSAYRAAEKNNRISFPRFATHVLPDPCKNIFSRYMSYYFAQPNDGSDDNCNVSVVKIKNNICASADMPVFWEIDERTLDSISSIRIMNSLPGSRSWTSHPHFESNGDYYNCSTDFDNDVYEFIRIPAVSEKGSGALDGIEVVASLPYTGNPSYYHCFGMTERFFIFIESSMKLQSYFESKRWNEVVLKLLNKTHADLMKFMPNEKSRFRVVDRKSGDVVAVYSVDPFFCFHQVNAYEAKNDEIVLDSCMYPDASVIDNLYLNEIRSGKMFDAFPAQLRRYRLPLGGIDRGPLETELERNEAGFDYELIHPSFEMPKINYDSYNGKMYRYTYGLGNSMIRRGLTTLLKIDVDSKEYLEWQEEDCYPSEPVFIASPNAREEDDGVLISAVLGLYSKQSFLLFLDGKSMKEIARGSVPSKLIPLFHGDFFSS